MFKNLQTKILRWKPVKKLLDLSRHLVLPGFQGIPLYDVGEFFFDAMRKGDILRRGAAIAFRFTLALFPTLILIISIIPFIPIEGFHDELMRDLSYMLPADIFYPMESIFEDMITRKHHGFLSIGFILTLYFASGGVNALLSGFQSAYYISLKKNPLKQRFTALVIMFVLSFLLMVAITILIYGSDYYLYLEEHGILEGNLMFILYYLVKWIVVTFLFLFSVTIVYNAGTADKKWKMFTPGAILATVLTIFVAFGFGFYVHEAGHYNKLYGSLGIVWVMLLMLYFNSVILLIGFEFNASIERARLDSSFDERRRSKEEDSI